MNQQDLKEHLRTSSLSKRVRTPTVIQMEAVECGAAALSIILGYHGRFVPLEELRYQCGVSRDGCDAFNLVEAAKSYDLDGHGYRISLENLPEVTLPCILYWQDNHFVVLEGCGSQFVYINDPAVGPVQIPYPNFFKSYSEVAFVLQPTTMFRKGGVPPRFWNLIQRRLSTVQFATILFLILIQLILIVLGLIPPALSRIFMDQIISQRMLSWKWFFLNFMAFTIVLQTIASIMRSNVTNRLSRKLAIVFSVDFLWHVLRLPLLFFTQRFGGEIINRMNLNTTVADFIINHISLITINLLLISIYGIVMFQYDPLIASIGILTALLSIGLLAFITRARANAYSRLQQELAKSVGIEMDALQSMEFIKATGTESFCFSRVIGYQIKNLNNFQNIGRKDIWLNTIAGFFNQMAGILLLSVGALRVMEGHLSIGMLLALQMLMTGFLFPINQLIGSSMQIQTLTIDMLRLDDVVKNPVDPLLLKPIHLEALPPAQLKGKITLERVTFGYSPLDDPLVTNLSLNIEPGQKIALVGRTGSGKSTVARILTGLFQPWSGFVKYDDIPIQELSREHFRHSLAWIDQDIMLFSGSIRNNLTLWKRDINDQMLDQATQDAKIWEAIKKRDYGYDAQLMENGANFSQGEKQRLEIARALLFNPTILILDEATSALDSQTEAEILQNVQRRKCTCVIVTHRLSTIKTCDRIYVLDQGKLVQEGTHEELKAVPGIYQELVRSDVPQEHPPIG